MIFPMLYPVSCLEKTGFLAQDLARAARAICVSKEKYSSVSGKSSSKASTRSLACTISQGCKRVLKASHENKGPQGLASLDRMSQKSVWKDCLTSVSRRVSVIQECVRTVYYEGAPQKHLRRVSNCLQKVP